MTSRARTRKRIIITCVIAYILCGCRQSQTPRVSSRRQLDWFWTKLPVLSRITILQRRSSSENVQGRASPGCPSALPSTLFNSSTPELKISSGCNFSVVQVRVDNVDLPWGLKLKSGGRKRPFGKRVFGSRSSSKNGWINASNCIRKTRSNVSYGLHKTESIQIQGSNSII